MSSYYCQECETQKNRKWDGVEYYKGELVCPDCYTELIHNEGITMYTFRDFHIPDRMMEGLLRYIDGGIPGGDFLHAVRCNNLHFAVNYADDENLANLPAYVGYLTNRSPGGCWGSADRVREWMKTKLEARNG